MSVAALAGLLAATVAGAQPRTGTIAGRITLGGKPPGNTIIRMGMDPGCAEMNRGRQVIQAAALVAADGSIANVFVRLDGTFPATPVPAAPVVIDQRGCLYAPRVVGVRVGQRLQIRSDDNVLHNVHSLSASSNGFNVAEAKAGAVFDFIPRSPELMLKLGCDVHRWMTAFVGVMAHPYFSVTDASGRFSIGGVPPGTYALRIWHERFGEQSHSVTVKPGATATVDLAYQGS